MNELHAFASPSRTVPYTLQVTVRGTVTNANAAAIQKAIDPHVHGAICCVILDLSETPTISSMGISFLGHLAERLDNRGGKVIILGIDPKVRVILTALGLEPFFQFAANFEEAQQRVLLAIAGLRVKPRLFVRNGLQKGIQFPIGDAPIVVGSDPDCSIPVYSAAIARRHAEFSKSENGCFVRDLGSKSGIAVNASVVGEAALKTGDLVTVGELELVYLAPGAPPPA